MIKNIEYSVNLETYDCPECEELETLEESIRNTQIADYAVFQILQFLQPWCQRHGGPVLDLNFQSPSDSRHHFQRDIEEAQAADTNWAG